MFEISKKDILKLQVSSVNRNDKNFGKQNLFDGCEDTCWSSDEGCPQWISIELKEKHCIEAFSLQFQGGFVGKTCVAQLQNDLEVSTENFYPDDVNSIQKFQLSKPMWCNKLKFVFSESTDFFGRIVLYFIHIFYK